MTFFHTSPNLHLSPSQMLKKILNLIIPPPPPPICILLKFDSAKFRVSNLCFFKSYRSKTFGGSAQALWYRRGKSHKVLVFSSYTFEHSGQKHFSEKHHAPAPPPPLCQGLTSFALLFPGLILKKVQVVLFLNHRIRGTLAYCSCGCGTIPCQV